MQLLLNQVFVSLRAPADQPKGYLEVINIHGAEGPNPSISIQGLPGVTQLQISSWFTESELDFIRSQNPHIYFFPGVL